MLAGVKVHGDIFTRQAWLTLVIGLTQAERGQIHTHLPRRSPCLYSTDGQSMGPETAQLLTATSLHSKKI